MNEIDVDRAIQDARQLAICIRNGRGPSDLYNHLPDAGTLVRNFYPVFVKFLQIDDGSLYDVRLQCLKGQVDQLVQNMQQFEQLDFHAQQGREKPIPVVLTRRDLLRTRLFDVFQHPQKVVDAARQDMNFFDQCDQQIEAENSGVPLPKRRTM